MRSLMIIIGLLISSSLAFADKPEARVEWQCTGSEEKIGVVELQERRRDEIPFPYRGEISKYYTGDALIDDSGSERYAVMFFNIGQTIGWKDRGRVRICAASIGIRDRLLEPQPQNYLSGLIESDRCKLTLDNGADFNMAAQAGPTFESPSWFCNFKVFLPQKGRYYRPGRRR